MWHGACQSMMSVQVALLQQLQNTHICITSALQTEEEAQRAAARSLQWSANRYRF
jgi:hypothetical protein